MFLCYPVAVVRVSASMLRGGPGTTLGLLLGHRRRLTPVPGAGAPTDLTHGFSVEMIWKSIAYDRMQAGKEN